MNESFVCNLEIKLFVQTFGEAKNPAVVLIAGAAGQAILWDRNFCENLAKQEYFVIRYDHRDTGLSSGIDFEQNPYNIKILAEDVIAILDHFLISKAHVIGMSMGGYIAQKLAIYYPERLLTLTFLMTTINSLVMRGIRGIDNLPGQNLEVVKKLAAMYQVPRLTLEDRVKVLTHTWQLFNGEKADFPYDEFYVLAEESYKRAKTKNAVKNHRLAVLNSPADRSKKLENLSLPPTLIIHGEEDPIIQVAHAYYSHKKLPQSKLLIIEKMGHLLTSLFIDQIEAELIEHFKSL